MINLLGIFEEIIRTIWLDSKRQKVNEYEELQNEIYDKLSVWRYGIKKSDISVTMEYTLCVGEFGSYSIFIKGLDYIWIDELKKIKNYSGWSVKTWSQGIELGCSSLRIGNKTTRGEKIEV